MRVLKCSVAALAALLLVALFFAWVSWGSSPGTWLPESRFVVGFIAIAAAAVAWMATYELLEKEEGRG